MTTILFTELHREVWRRDEGPQAAMRSIPDETALALHLGNGSSYAVMMGTPRDLRDFAVGFSLTEGIIQSPEDISTLDIVDLDDGIEVRIGSPNPEQTG